LYWGYLPEGAGEFKEEMGSKSFGYGKMDGKKVGGGKVMFIISIYNMPRE